MEDDSKLNSKKVEWWKRQKTQVSELGDEQREDKKKSKKLDLCKEMNVSKSLANLIRENERKKN